MSQDKHRTYVTGFLTGICIGRKPVKKRDAVVSIISAEGIHSFYVKNFSSSQFNTLFDLGAILMIDYKYAEPFYFASQIKLVSAFRFISYADFLLMNFIFDLTIHFKDFIQTDHIFNIINSLIRNCQMGIENLYPSIELQLMLLEISGGKPDHFKCGKCLNSLKGSKEIVAPYYRMELFHSECVPRSQSLPIRYDLSMIPKLCQVLEENSAIPLIKTDPFFKTLQTHLCHIFKDDIYSEVTHMYLRGFKSSI